MALPDQVTSPPSTPGDPNATPLPASYDAKYLAYTFTTYSSVVSYAWDLDGIRTAINQHVRGEFIVSAYLADYTLRDPAVHAARLQRVSPLVGLRRQVARAKRRAAAGSPARGKGIAALAYDEACTLFEEFGALSPGALADYDDDQAVMGVSIAQNIWHAREDGSGLDLEELRPWPMRAARYNPYLRRYQIQTVDGLVTIEHGDGKWVIFQPRRIESHKSGAIVALGEAFADRRFAVRDRAQNSEIHGLAKPLGTLPEGVKIDDVDGKNFRAELRRLQQPRSGMVKPYGSEVKYLEPSGQPGQIFENIIKGEDADIAKILLGQDSSTTGAGGNYMKARFMWGVRNDIVERDVSTIAHGVNTGSLRPFAVINYGDPLAAATVGWPLPDPSEDERRESLAMRTRAFHAAIWDARANGFRVDQVLVNKVAEDFGVEAPTLGDPLPPPLALAGNAGPLKNPTGGPGRNEGPAGPQPQNAAQE